MPLKKHLIVVLSTFFYVGYLPFIPGTFGSIAGVCVFYLIKASGVNYLLVTAAIALVGFLVSGEAEKVFGKKDARTIVIDEVSGMLIALGGIPGSMSTVFIAFIFFRILDTLKPFPAGRLEHLKGGLGVMIDDVIAGGYTLLIIQLALKCATFRAS